MHNPKSLQLELLKHYQYFFQKENLTPYDSKVLNKALYQLMQSYYFKEQANDKMLFESKDVCIVKSLARFKTTDTKSFGLEVYNCLKDDRGHYIIPMEEDKYENCDYMDDEEFEEYERYVENTTFYSKDIFRELKAVLSTTTLKEINDLINTIDEATDSYDLLSKLKELKKDDLVLRFMDITSHSYEQERAIEKSLDGEPPESIFPHLASIDRDVYGCLLQSDWDAIVNRDLTIKQLKKHYELDESVTPEQTLDYVFNNDALAAEILDAHYNESGRRQVLSDFENRPEIQAYYNNKLLDCFKSFSDDLKSSVVFDETVEHSLENEAHLDEFLSHLRRIPEYQMLLEDDPLKQQIYLKKASDYAIDSIPLKDISYDFVTDYLTVNYDWQNKYYETNGMTLIEPKHHRDDDGSLMFLAYNEYEIVGGATLMSGANYSGSDSDDLVLTGVATNERFRNQKIAEGLFREVLDYCHQNQKNLMRTRPTQDGAKTIRDKFSTIAENEYSDVLVINYEEKEAYSFLKEYAQKNNLTNKQVETAFEHYRQSPDDRTDVKKLFGLEEPHSAMKKRY